MSRQPPFRVDCTFRNDTLLFNVHFWCVTPMSRIPEREPIPPWTHPRRPGCMEDTVGSFGLVPQKIHSRTILLAQGAQYETNSIQSRKKDIWWPPCAGLRSQGERRDPRDVGSGGPEEFITANQSPFCRIDAWRLG